MGQKIFRGSFLFVFMLLMFGCASSQVNRVESDKVVDLSGRWNDSDAQMVANDMIRDAVANKWATGFRAETGRLPVVVVGPIVNNSHEHINSEVFTKSLERSLLNTGEAKFVAAKSERFPVRDERSSQQEGFTDPETISAFGKEVGADYILIGSVNSVKDEFKGRYVILYQINLELIDIETNLKVWIGQKMLKKIVRRSKYSL